MNTAIMSSPDTTNPTLASWQKRSQSRLGRWLFAQTLCRREPFFRSLKPHFLELRPALCTVVMPKSRATGGKGNTAHSLAIATLCELTASTVTEVTLPPNMNWYSRGMTIEYLRQAESDVTATARLDKTDWGDAQNVAVPVSAIDRNGREVVRAVITIRVEPKRI
jgi:acyl-coenzyme A thioesterase PaaI-like protein